eukprot:TRINITY_DN75605_c0_g1_i1.p1 TRINITY_DN75605_c0_g1~~TRINITY_DN75605_c0_g1_i1.p1  ORF type:complete len:296 (+),score=42.30 TRINITY_DN75605_c0_g1_i1:60-947(+)
MSSTSMTKRRLRILALHGCCQNAMAFEQLRTKDLQKRLRDIAEFVFIDAPILAEKSADGNLSLDRRSWFSLDAADPTNFDALFHERKLEWYQFEETCLYLESVLRERGPFDGIMGFSQGGNAAAVFVDQYLRQGRAVSVPLTMTPRFVILISASLTPTPTNFPAFPQFAGYKPMKHKQDRVESSAESASPAAEDDQGDFDLAQEASHMTLPPALQGSPRATQTCMRGATKPVPDQFLPTLHIWGAADEFLPAARSEELAEVFADPAIFVHDKGHSVPQSGAACKIYREFLERFLN